MNRGLLIVLAGMFPLAGAIALSAAGGSGPSARDARYLVLLVFALMACCFVIGTTIIMTDKGQSGVFGFALGLIAPIGTIIALLVSDKKNPSAEPQPAVAEQTDTSIYSKWRNKVVMASLVIAIVYGIAHSVIYSRHMLSFRGGYAPGKIAICVMMGLISALSCWGIFVMFSVTFAPTTWFKDSPGGKLWIARTGLRTQGSTVAVRVMTFLLGAISACVYYGCVMALVSAVSK